MRPRYPDERYKQDAHFAALVDMLYNTLLRCEFTSTDVREAAMLAQIKYELNNPRPITFSPEMKRYLEHMEKEPK